MGNRFSRHRTSSMRPTCPSTVWHPGQHPVALRRLMLFPTAATLSWATTRPTQMTVGYGEPFRSPTLSRESEANDACLSRGLPICPEKTSCAFVQLLFCSCPINHEPGMTAMNMPFRKLTGILLVGWLSCAALVAADSSSDVSVFKDKNLEKAVRRFVFEKRDNDKPITEADVANLSTIQGPGMDIADLSGLEKCLNLASLDLPKNKIQDLAPLKGLSKLQYMNLADNQIEELAPLAEVKALQYLELSNNRVKELQPLAGLTNLASLYLSNNQITDIAPIVKLPRLASLYLDRNRIKSIAGAGQLGGLT